MFTGKGLVFLIEFLVYEPGKLHKEDVELISPDIKNVIHEAVFLFYSSSKGSEAELALFQLLQKIELLN